MKSIKLLLAALTLSFAITPAWAVLITGVNDPVNNLAEWTASGNIISVKNISKFDARITSIAFDLASVTLTSVDVGGTEKDEDWRFVMDQIVGGTGGGEFDYGATTQKDTGNAERQLLGGKANSGIKIGNTGTFNFGDILNLDLTNATNLFVRFQRTGSDGEGSDRGRYCTGVDCDPPQGVPEPSIIALFGLGLLGLGFASRRKA
jgi:hypothetical protein